LTRFAVKPILAICVYSQALSSVVNDNFDKKFDDSDWMREAINAARFAAAELDEIPIGAVVVSSTSGLLATAGNRTRTHCDPTAHAEIVALRDAAGAVGNYRLVGATIYSTIEPCAMCAGALIQARVKRLVYGAPDERFGAVRTQFQICDNSSLNHRIEIVSGVLENECRQLMQDFFQRRRNEVKSQKEKSKSSE
jgi:tRNA(adenine34) deaminase